MGLLTLALSACGGGGGTSGSSGLATVTDSVSCALATGNCSSSSHLSSSTSPGVWVLSNSSTADVVLNFNLTGLPGNTTVLFVLNNESSSASMNVASYFYGKQSDSPTTATSGTPGVSAHLSDVDPAAHSMAEHGRMRQRPVPLPLFSSNAIPSPSKLIVPGFSASYGLGSGQSWYVVDGSNVTQSVSATVRATRTLSDGKTLLIWVQDSEYAPGKITSSLVTDYADTFATASTGIYDRVRLLSANGQVWGAQAFSNLIPSSTNEIHLVMSNLTPDGTSYGLLGYFYALNNFFRTGCSYCSTSNEALTLFLDTETIYLGGLTGQQAIKGTMIHELTHMINFYRRYVSLGTAYDYDSWLEEMTAMTMEDLLETNYGISSTAAVTNMPKWVSRNNYRCSPFVFDNNMSSTCFSYRVGSIYGAYLLRQYGLPYYQNLLTQSATTDAVQALNNAIAAASPGSSALQAVRRMNAGASMLRLTSPPAPYRYPAISGTGYSAPAITLSSYASQQGSVSGFPFPDTTVSNLPAGGASISVVKSTSTSLTQTLPLPPSSSLTVVVQQ
jgi:hypothetical protein